MKNSRYRKYKIPHCLITNSLFIGLFTYSLGASAVDLQAMECTSANYQQALVNNQQVVESDAGNLPARLALTRCLLQRNHLQQAQTQLKTISAIDANQVDALLMQGEVYERHGELTNAKTQYQKATQLVPKDARAFVKLSNVLRALGDEMAADTAYERYKALQQPQ